MTTEISSSHLLFQARRRMMLEMDQQILPLVYQRRFNTKLPGMALLFLVLCLLVAKASSETGLRVEHTKVGVLVRDESEVEHSRDRREVHRGMRGFNYEEKMIILERHNTLRSGRDASDMLRLRWDDGLERTSQQYAELCIFEHSSTRYDSAGFDYVGENLYVGTAVFRPEDVVQAWYDEVDFYNYYTQGCRSGQMCGHYTQIVWAKTEAVGCGVKYCTNLQGAGFFEGYNVVCQYGPGGNYVGQKPYQLGAVCSQCPQEKPFCFENLCSATPHIRNGSVTSAPVCGFSLQLVALFTLFIALVYT